MATHTVDRDSCFSPAQEKFDQLLTKLQNEESFTMTSSELEVLIRQAVQGIARDLIEAKMNQIGHRQTSSPVIGVDGLERDRKKLMPRGIETSFGEVDYKRWGYGTPGVDSLFPADGHLNLPLEKYSHELRRLVSEDITRNSYDDALDVLSDRTGAEVPKRQGIELAERAAADFEGFYEERCNSGSGIEKEENFQPEESGPLLILTTDAKGVVMRTEGLREQTKKAALEEKHKLKKRLSRGEKRNRKRMSQVASVYTVEPFVRTAEEVVEELWGSKEDKKVRRRPRPENKRVWASVERGTDEVLEEMFAEARAREPQGKKQWVALVDGNPYQLKQLKKKAKEFGVQLTIVFDIIHVLEYLWKAAWAFYKEGSQDAEAFVGERLLRLLDGGSCQVAKGIRRMATCRGLRAKARKPVDKCADYLLKYAPGLRYDRYLAQGLPIATGVIEGACRYLVKDRMEITGARWNIKGAEAVLRLRSIRSSGDFAEYWHYHEKMERERNHISKYINGLPPLCCDVPRTVYTTKSAPKQEGTPQI